MRAAIVTGANGFLGRYLVRTLAGSGYRVLAVVRSEASDLSHIANIENVSMVYCQMADIASLPELIGEDWSGAYFFHLAWEGSSGPRRADYELQLQNSIYTAKAAKVAKVLGCKRIIFAGSITQLMYRDYLRMDAIMPELVTCYSIGKLAAESIVKCLCPSLGISWNWAYITNFYGADDPTNNFIRMLIEHYSRGETPVLTPATQLADFTHVSDVAEGLLALAERGEIDSAYYVGAGNPRPLREFIQEVRDIVAPSVDTGIGLKPFQGLNVDFDAIDYRRLQRDTGFEAKVRFAEGIRLML